MEKRGCADKAILIVVFGHKGALEKGWQDARHKVGCFGESGAPFRRATGQLLGTCYPRSATTGRR